ncbi:sporulation YhaL family protein [Bacillus sp. 03113]|uniref:sporulation YhaL family protein n=1 Tax=Bacillus sp. 03113 TaxID=2578211 RepID=UPI002852E4E8|nr:sporulation YhaL family protein [Bacillus sp. 03113]
MIIPIWVYFVVVGIVISMYMAIRTGRAERKQEEALIERDGEIFMKRIEEEKERKLLKSE